MAPWKRGLLVLMGIVLALLLGELGVRVLHRAPEIKPIKFDSRQCVYRRSRDAILGFELKPNYRNAKPDLIQSYERTNSHGQRDKERSIHKKAGVRRILLLGDSVVEGHGLKEEDTLSHQLELLYPDQRTEVLNFGVSAYCTLAEVELLETKGLQFEPDLVVLVFVENDFDNFNKEAFVLEGIQRPAVLELGFKASHLFRLVCVRFNLFGFGLETDPVRWNQNGIGDNNVVTAFERLKKLSDAHGFGVLIAIWPRFSDDRVEDVHTMPDGRDLIVERLAAMNGLRTVRLSAFFQSQAEQQRQSGEFNPRLVWSQGDGMHPSPTGARVAARALRHWIDQMPAAVEVHDEAEGAAVAAARSLSGRPSYVRVQDRLGSEYLKAGNLKEAIRHFQLALEEDPQDAGTYNNLGFAYEQQGDSRAMSAYQKAVELDPSIAQAHYNLARMYLLDQRPDDAIQQFRQAVQLKPDYPEAQNLLGVELGKQGRFDEAAGHFLKAIASSPDNPEYLNNHGVVLSARGEYPEALKQFRRALELDPGDPFTLRNIERIRRLMGSAPRAQ